MLGYWTRSWLKKQDSLQKVKVDFASRGCAEILTLVLLGQTEIAKANKGMLVALIDFAKAYDKVEWRRMWGCLEELRIKGRLLRLKDIYHDNVCQVEVHDKLSMEFDVNTGLGQGCVPCYFPCTSMM